VANHAVLRWLPGSSSPEALILYCVLATVVVVVLARCAALLAAIVGAGFGRRITFDVASDLFSHMQRLSLRYHRINPIGDAVHRVMKDTSCASVLVRDAMIPAVTSLL